MGLLGSLHVCCLHECLCTRVCKDWARTALLVPRPAQQKAFVCGVSIGCHRSRGVPLAAFPPRCAAQPCRSQLLLRNKSFYSWHRGCAPSLLRWVPALRAERAAARDLQIYSLEKEAASLPRAPCSPARAGRAGGAVNDLPAQPRGSHPPRCPIPTPRSPAGHGAGASGDAPRAFPRLGAPSSTGGSRGRLCWAPCPAGREPGRAGRGATAGKGSGVSCPAQPAVRWSHSPWSGSFLPWAGGHEHQHGLGTRTGWFCCMSHCSSGMFPTGSCPAGSEGRPWAPQEHPTAPHSQLTPGSRSQGCQEQ